jgi:hypothetical protein
MREGSIFAESGLARIFEGELEVRGGRSQVRGFHLEDAGVMLARGIVVDEATRTAKDSRGVYHAQITMQGKGRHVGLSGFFPHGWSRALVEEAVKEAYETRRPRGWHVAGNFFEGRTRAGMKILMELDEGSLVLDAFPLRNRNNPQKNRARDAQLRIRRGISKKHPLVCSHCQELKVLVCPSGHNVQLHPALLLRQMGAMVRWLMKMIRL